MTHSHDVVYREYKGWLSMSWHNKVSNTVKFYMARLFVGCLLASGTFSFVTTSFVTTQAHALPQNFPDLSHYKDVDANQYVAHLFVFSQQKVVFITPNGIECTLIANSVTRCIGHFYKPGAPANICKIAIVNPDVNVPFPVQNATDLECQFSQNPPKLTPGLKITYTGTTCAVGEHDLVACISRRQHGFVLTDNSSTAF